MQFLHNQRRLGSLFLDCGAHSVHTGFWDTLPIDDYIKFVNEYHYKFEYVACPDVIGNTDATLKNSAYFCERVEIPPEKIVPVYHLQVRKISDLERVLDFSQGKGFKRMALGGALGVGFSDIQKYVILEKSHEVLAKRGNPFQIHYFGIAHPHAILAFSPDSVDSATFIHKAKYMHVHEYNYKNARIYNRTSFTDYFKRSTLTQRCADTVKSVRHLLDGIEGVDDEKYVYDVIEKQPDAIKLIIANGLNVVEFEHYVRERNKTPHFRHFVSAPPGIATGYTGLVGDLCHLIWNNRSLASYAQFWELSSSQLEDTINIFGAEGDEGIHKETVDVANL